MRQLKVTSFRFLPALTEQGRRRGGHLQGVHEFSDFTRLWLCVQPSPSVRPRKCGISPNSAKAFADPLDGAGFPWATPRSFRHNVASLRQEAGVVVKVADRLGPADPTMTARVYLGRDAMGDKSSQVQHL